MSSSKFNPYKVDHLFLLIGENPLPNYVAAKLLLETGGNVYLVYTNGTVRQATQLQRILDDEVEGCQPCQLISLEDYKSDAYNIQRKIQKWMEKLPEGSIGMNYTGGTKAMAVHAYRAALEVKEEKGKDIKFSYLDPHKLAMCFDHTSRESDVIKIQPNCVEVALDILFKLHGWEDWISETTEYTSKLNTIAKELAVVHSDFNSAYKWRKWCRDFLRDENGDWKKGKGKQVVKLDYFDGHHKIKEVFYKLGISDNSKFKDLDFQSLGLAKLGNIYDWIDGTWLEHFALIKIEEIREQYQISDIKTSIYIKNPNSNDKTKFEIDVAFMRGHQLFAISCSTAMPLKKEGEQKLNNHYFKNKLYEAYIRARQLGGDEARVALICCANGKEVNELRTEITNVFQPDSEKDNQKDTKLTVFGREDLLNLSEKISEWIDDNDQEAAK